MSNDSPPAARPYGRRADAERNRESILDHAARLLSLHPSAGMDEIAAAAGVGRATLYRHFPAREALIEAINARAIDDTERAIRASRLDDDSACEALRRRVAALLDEGDRYGFLLTQNAARAAGKRLTADEARLSAPLYDLFARGQAAGEFTRSLSPALMTTALGVMIIAVMREIAVGRIDRDKAAAVASSALLHGLLGQEPEKRAGEP